MPSVIEDLGAGESFTDTPVPVVPAEVPVYGGTARGLKSSKPITPEVQAQLDQSSKGMRAALAEKGIEAPPMLPEEAAKAAAEKEKEDKAFAGLQEVDPFSVLQEVDPRSVGEEPEFRGVPLADRLDTDKPEDLARDPKFNILEHIATNRDNIFQDPNRYKKALDTYRAQKVVGTTANKVWESAKKETGPLLLEILKSLPKRLENVSDIAIGPVINDITAKFRHESADPVLREQWDKMTDDNREAAIAEAIGGTQLAVGSLQDMVRQGARKLTGPGFNLKQLKVTPSGVSMERKDWSKISDEEVKSELFKDLGWHDTIQGISSGQTVKDLVSEGVQLNPENIKLLSLTDPVTLVATAGGLKAVGVGGKVLFTAANEVGAGKALNYLGQLSQTAAAKTTQLVGTGLEKTGQTIAAALPFSGQGVSVGAGLSLLGIPHKAILAARVAAPVLKKTGQLVREIGEAAGAAPKGQLSLGLETTTGAKLVNAAKTASKFVQPPVAGAVKGAVGTAPLALSTDEPQGGLLGVGAVGGAVHSALGAVKGAVAEAGAKKYFDPGQINWEATPSPGYDNFTELNKVHEQVAASTPSNARNMVDSLRETLRPFGKKLFLVDDAAFSQAIADDTKRANGGKDLTPEQQAAVAQESKARGVSKIWMADDAGKGEMVTLVKSSADAPHEFSHVLESVMEPAGREALHDAVRKAYTPAELDALQAHYEKQFGRPFTPAEVRSEFIADNWANLLYNTSLESLGLPKPKSSFRAKMLDAALTLGDALGIDMTAGRGTPGLNLKPSYSLRKALENASGEILAERDQRAAQQATAPEVKPVAEAPAAPVEVPVESVQPELDFTTPPPKEIPAQGELNFETPSAQPKVAPAATPPAPAPTEVPPTVSPSRGVSTPEATAARAEVTNTGVGAAWAKGKDNEQAVTEVNKALDESVGLTVEHAGAPKASFKPTEPERAAEVEEGRGLPPEQRELHAGKKYPTRWEQTKSGEPQLVARSVDKVLSNVDRAVQWGKSAGEEIPWETDANGALTEAGTNELLSDLNAYWDNQDRGFRGGGKQLVRPGDELGAAIPREQGEGKVLGDAKEQWLNLLQGKDVGPPETARAQKGKLPANIKAQEIRAAQGDVSERIAPGTDIPIYPEKVTQGRGAVEVKETNPLRNRLRAAGMPVGDLHTVVERLNAADIIKAERAPELTGRGGQTDTARAGYLTDQPVDKTIADVFADSPDDWTKRFGPKNTLTATAYELGLGLKSKEELNALRAAQSKASADQVAVMGEVKAGNFDKMDEAYALATKTQFFREAIEAATDTASAAGPSGWRRSFPDRTAPFAEGAAPERAGFLSEKELKSIRNGEKDGETFNGDGTVFVPPEDASLDVVTLASVNLPAAELNAKNVAAALKPYKGLLGNENIKAGIFRLSEPDAEGRPQVSVDVNAIVDQKHRKSSLAFARANNQEAIFDMARGKTVDAGGTGNTVLRDPKEIAQAADALQAGENYLETKARFKTAEAKRKGPVRRAIEDIKGDVGITVKAITRESEAAARKRVEETDYSKYNVPEKAVSKVGQATGWVLPDGEFVSLDTAYHEQFIADNAKSLNEKYGTEFGETADVNERQAAINKGFVRVRHVPSTGQMNIEASADHWTPKTRSKILDILDKQSDNIDKLRVTLLDKKGQTVDSIDSAVFDLEGAEKFSKMEDAVSSLKAGPVSKKGPSAIQIARSREGYLAEPKEAEEITDTLRGISPEGNFKLVGSVSKGKVGAKDMDFAVDYGTGHVESEIGNFLDKVAPELEKKGWTVHDEVHDFAGKPEGQWFIPTSSPKGDVVEFFFGGSTDEAPPGSYPSQRKGYLTPEIPTDEAITDALSEDKKPFVGAARDLDEGTPVGLRIDIPAFNRTGKYVITVHEKAEGGRVGKRIGYDSIATVDNPTFFSNTKGAAKIAEGAAKFPIATVEGEWNPSRELPADLSEWTEVGFNPDKHDYFYEKGTDEPVTGGTQAVSVGNSVFVKDATFGSKADVAARGGYLPGEKLTPETAEAAADKHNEEYTKSYPEAYPTRFIRDSKGKLKLQGGKLVPGDEEAVLDKTPLALDAVRENPDAPAHEVISDALADKIVAEAHEALKDESMKAGLSWYADAVKLINKFFGKDASLFAQLLAATSPQNGVQPNFAYAVDAWNAVKRGEYEPFVKKYLEGREQWKTGGTPEIAEWEAEKGKKWKAGTGAAAQGLRNNFLTWWVDKHEILPKREGGKLYGMHSFPVLDVISGTWLEDVGGPKVRNFLANLTGEGHDATIDIWATRFLMRIAQSEDTLKGRWRVAPPAGWQISAENFNLAQSAFRKAAEKFGTTPDSLQALVWFSEKHLWEQKDWTGYVGAAKSDYAYWLKSLEPGEHPETYNIPVKAKEEATRQGREERARAAAKRKNAAQGELDIPVNPVED